WAGIGVWAVIGAALLSRRPKLQPNPQWVAATLTLAVSVGAFGMNRYILRHVLPPPPGVKPYAEEYAEGGKKGKVLDEDAGVLAEGGPPMQKIFTGKGFVEVMRSFANSGKWLASLLWMPMYIGVTSKKMTVSLPVNLFGWALIVLCWITAWKDAK